MEHKTEINRHELYELLWNKKQVEICSSLNISRHELIKICDRYSIPRPKPGYWTQKQMGKSPQRPPLSSDEFGPDTLIEFTSQESEPNLLVDLKKLRLEIPARLSKPLPQIVLAKEIYDEPTYQYDFMMVAPIRTNPEVIALKVSKATFQRSLKIMQVLLKAFEVLGWSTGTVTDRQTHLNTITSDGIDIRFRLREEMKQRPRQLTAKEQQEKEMGRYIYKEKILVPSGKLLFEIDEYLDGQKSTWKDSKTKLIEEMLPEIIEGLAKAKDVKRKRLQQQERLEREREVQRQKELKKRHQHQTFSKQVDSLFDAFILWQESKKLQQFSHSLKIATLEVGPPDEKTFCWLNWIQEIINEMSPIEKLVTSDKSEWLISPDLKGFRSKAIRDNSRVSGTKGEKSADNYGYSYFQNHSY